MTHEELVEKAAKWLSQKHAIVITELVSYAVEIPDALGFTYDGFTTLVECKASKADFKSDAKKFFRKNPEFGMGTHRYYMCPANLIEEDELPEGWGLLWVYDKKIVIKYPSDIFTPPIEQERILLISAMRRIGQKPPKGLKVKSYTYTSNQKMLQASIGVEEED